MRKSAMVAGGRSQQALVLKVKRNDAERREEE